MLDPIAERYANALFTTEAERIRQEHGERRRQVIAELAKRNVLPNTSGYFHSEMTRLGIEQAEALANARAHSMLAAYEKAHVPLDDQAVTDIHRQIVEFCQAQGRSLTNLNQQQIQQTRFPADMTSALGGTIARAVSGIEARIYRELSAKRDEQIMAARHELNQTLASSTAPQGPSEQRTPEIAEAKPLQPKGHWTRDQKIGIAIGIPAIVLAVLAIIVAITTPEIRQKLRLEKKPEAISQKPSTTLPSTTSVPGKEQPNTDNTSQPTQSRQGSRVQKPPNNPKVGFITQGPGSITQIGGSGNQATVNNLGPPPAKIAAWEQAPAKWQEEEGLVDETQLTLTVDHSMEIPAFQVKCNRPCFIREAAIFGAYNKVDYLTGNDQTVAGAVFISPRPLGAGIKVEYRIRGKDGTPPKIESVSIIQRERLPAQDR